MATPHVAPPTKKVKKKRVGHFAQRKYQAKQKEAGNCRGCGKPRPPELKQLCRICQDKQNTYMAAYRAKKKAAAVAPDVNCVTLANGDCVGTDCMHDPKGEGEASGTVK